MEVERMMYEKVRKVVGGSAVVVLTQTDCCMSHVAKQLLFGLGVGPTVIELHSSAAETLGTHLPAIFVGGKFLGGIESLMACHINGSLVPLLKQAGALWL